MEVIPWLEECILCQKNIIPFLPIIGLLESCKISEYNDMLYRLSKEVLNACNMDIELSEESINHLATLLMKDFVQDDISSWLNSCHHLLKNAEHAIYRNEFSYSAETVLKLFSIYREANQKDSSFPPVFVLRYTLLKKDYIEHTWKFLSDGKLATIPPYRYSDLVFLTSILDIKPIREHIDQEEMGTIPTCIDTLLKVMFRHNTTLLDLWTENPHIILALCRTIDEYSAGIQNQLLSELEKLVGSLKTHLSIELYLEIENVSRKYKHMGLQQALKLL